MLGGQHLHGRQSYTPSAAVGVVTAFRLVVSVEYLIDLGVLDTYACIADIHLQVVIPVAGIFLNRRVDGHLTARGREFKGVGYKVVQDALHVIGREPHLFVVIDAFHEKLQLLLVGREGMRPGELLNKRHRIPLLQIEREGIVGQLIKCHELIDEEFHLIGVVERDVESPL